MHINFKLLNSRGITPLGFMFLCAVKGNKTEDNSAIIEYQFKEELDEFRATNLIDFIKPKNKSQNDYNTVRLTSLGNEWIDDITTPNVEEQHLKMRDYLISIYLNHEDTERIVGNKKLIAIYISILQTHLCIDIYQFYYLCEFFLSEHVFTKKLENIFMDRNKIRYGDFKNHIEDSSLFQFYEQKKKEVENYWKQKIK